MEIISLFNLTKIKLIFPPINFIIQCLQNSKTLKIIFPLLLNLNSTHSTKKKKSITISSPFESKIWPRVASKTVIAQSRFKI